MILHFALGLVIGVYIGIIVALYFVKKEIGNV